MSDPIAVTLSVDEAWTEARFQEEYALEVLSNATTDDAFSLALLRAVAESSWVIALAVLANAGVLTAERLAIGKHLTENRWAGTLDELLQVIENLAEPDDA